MQCIVNICQMLEYLAHASKYAYNYIKNVEFSRFRGEVSHFFVKINIFHTDRRPLPSSGKLIGI